MKHESIRERSERIINQLKAKLRRHLYDRTGEYPLGDQQRWMLGGNLFPSRLDQRRPYPMLAIYRKSLLK